SRETTQRRLRRNRDPPNRGLEAQVTSSRSVYLTQRPIGFQRAGGQEQVAPGTAAHDFRLGRESVVSHRGGHLGRWPPRGVSLVGKGIPTRLLGPLSDRWLSGDGGRTCIFAEAEAHGPGPRSCWGSQAGGGWPHAGGAPHAEG